MNHDIISHTISKPIRHTKIIATIGPASSDEIIISEMIQAGMDIARLNLSYGTLASHKKVIASIRMAEKKTKRKVGLLIDIPGPKLRLGTLPISPLTLRTGDHVIFTGEKSATEPLSLPISDKTLIPLVVRGDQILIADGSVVLTVQSFTNNIITAKVDVGGVVRDNSGVVFPGKRPDVNFITDTLVKNLAFAVEEKADYIALSFVSSDKDVYAVRDVLLSIPSDMIIIAKIEQESAVTHYETILKASDGIMVARGDLGVEMPIEQIPHIQKSLIQKANRQKIPIITATEMLESMIHHGRPTRAEVTDVANAIMDGTDAIMLSAETSVGTYPVRTVQMMASIAVEAEKHLPYRDVYGTYSQFFETPVSIGDVISAGACYTAMQLKSRIIVAFTRSGKTAERASSCRPKQPILAITSQPRVYRRLLLWWGVEPVLHTPIISADTLFENAVKIALSTGYASYGDTIVIVAGIPTGQKGSTNMMKVELISDK